MDDKDLVKKKNKYLKIIENLNEKLIYLLEQLDFLIKNKIITQDLYIEKMLLLNNINDKINYLDEYISKKNNKKNINDQINHINDLLQKVCLKIGSTNLLHILDIFLLNDFIEKQNSSYKNLLNCYNEYFIPLSCVKISEMDKFIKKHNIIFKDTIHVVNLLDISKNNTLNEKIDGASIIFCLDNKILYMNGYFKKDNLLLFKNSKEFKNKLNNIDNKNELNEIPALFKEKYIEQISIKDFIILNENEIISLIKSDYQEYLNYKNKPLSILIKEFIKLNIDKQRKIIILFLITDEESQFTAHIIFDLISDKNYTYESQNLSELLYTSFHWNIQKIFKITYNNLEQSKKNLDNLSINDVPYESRILLMNTTDNIKSKAMEKLKEINGSKDNSIKAQQWLDGFLKIPFNIHKKEPILEFFKNFQNKISTFIDVFMIRISEYDYEKLDKVNKNIYNNISQIIDEYYSNIQKSENSYHIFIKYLEKIMIDIIDEYNTKNMEDNIDNIDLDHIHLYNIEFFNYIFKILNEMKNYVDEWYEFKIKKKNYLKEVDIILDKCTYGQTDAKKQMKRIIGQWMNGVSKGQCFGLCGPPGVGKTTLCKNGLAKCLFDENNEPRPFAFLPLGGATNGSILEGHHYTYLGSTWGKIIDILMETKCINPIIYIDELDKISKTEHGREIVSILTHITDQSQNKEFYDRYFSSIPIDLSQILFIFSYNDRDNIDKILRDRIQEITIHPLSNKEKLIISQNYICPEIYTNIGFTNSEIIIHSDIINKIIDEYTYEAGVRKLNEILYDIVRDVNLKKIENDDLMYPVIITEQMVENILCNIPKLNSKKIGNKPKVGLVNGLYATNAGLGGLTIIQVMKTISDRKLTLEKLTGSQGDVMKESMNCALTLAWNIIPDYIKKNLNESSEHFGLHIHCPESATPKDGPSAGLAITTAIISRITGIPIKNDIAMTGEVDLLGNAHEIGGLYSKLQGALQAGVKQVLIPKNNEKDLDIIFMKEEENKKELIKSQSIKNIESFLLLEDNCYSVENNKKIFRNIMEIIMVENIYDVLKYALTENDIKFIENF